MLVVVTGLHIDLGLYSWVTLAVSLRDTLIGDSVW